MSGEAVSERELAFQRGWYSALDWLMAYPHKTVSDLEKAAERALAWSQITEERNQEEESPYV